MKFIKKILPVLLSFLLAASPSLAAPNYGSGIFNGGTSSSSGGSPTSPGGTSGSLQINDGGNFAGILQSPIYVTDPTYGAACNELPLIATTTTTVGGVTQVCDANYTFVAGDVNKPIAYFAAATPVTAKVNSTIASISSGCAVLANLGTGNVTSTGITLFGTDDTVAIQAAANAANPVDTNTVSGSWVGKGNKVIINGMCAITAPITIRSGVKFEAQGAGTGVVWLSTHTMGVAGYEAAFTGLFGNGTGRTYTDNAFSNMECNGNASFTTSYSFTAKCIDIPYTNRLKVTNNYIHGFPATNLGVDFNKELIAINNVFEDCGKSWTPGGGGGSCIDFETGTGYSYTVANNQFNRVGRSAIRNTNAGAPVPKATYPLIVNNNITVNYANSVCIEDDGNQGTIIDNNRCVQTVNGAAAYFAIGGGITTSGSDGTPGITGTVSHNQIIGPWYNGIAFSDADGSSANGWNLDGNTINGALHYGIAINENSPNTLTGLGIRNNHISLVGDACIGFINNGTSGTIANPSVIGNTLYDCASTTATDALKSGIYDADTVTNGTMQANNVFDDGTATQKYGFTLAAGITANWQMGPNNFTGNTTAELNILGTLTGGYLKLPFVLTPSISGAAIATNFNFGTSVIVESTLTHSASTAISNPTNPLDGGYLLYILTQDGTGSNAITWGNAFDFGATGTPTLSTGAGKVDYVGFRYNAALTKWVYQGQALGN